MLGIWTALLAAAGAAQSPAPDYRAGYEFAHRCFVATSGYRDESGARRAYDAVMRLGRLQSLTNRQLNADFERFSAYETVKLASDHQYRDALLAQCRQIGLAS
jgi:hypothetical protein